MSDQTANWVIMVYISADRVLTNFAVESLKQLKRAASEETVALIQVHSSNDEARRYVFNGKSAAGSSIDDDLVSPILPPLSPGGIADPANLTKFIEWASRYEAKHRCLFLWGHGYELLLNEDDQGSSKSSGRKYLTPNGLREALENAQGSPQARLDIIGIDACSMSLVELASELVDYGDFLVASQEDVPDQSFPYEAVLRTVDARPADGVEEVSMALPRLYREAYQDYAVGEGMGTAEITLTSVRLKNVGKITEVLRALSTALISSVDDPPLYREILAARQESREFALGLFVDLKDFCLRLSEKLAGGELKVACDAVCRAIEDRGAAACILENRSGGKNGVSECHGLSIYMPYLAKTQLDNAQKAFMNDGTDLVEQLPLLIKGGTNHLLKARSVRISEIEKDFDALTEFKGTRWIEFIKHGWSVILAREEANELDDHYSAQQCAANLLSLCGPSSAIASRKVAAGS
jgi:hypothetical protein